jgi:hypothetical protein
MTEEKKPEAPEVVELVAIERGFAMGKLIEPGRKFMFRTTRADGKPRKLPKWAQLASQPVPRKVERKNGDLKPVDAQKAVAAKAGALAGGTPAGGGNPGDPLV